MYQYDYPMPAVTADVAVICGDNVLLIERKDGKGYALPGGFINPDENVTQCAVRELKEETGIELKYPSKLKMFNVYSEPKRDDRRRVISVLHTYEPLCIPFVKPADDAVGYRWVTFNEIELGLVKLAFDHKEMLIDVANFLRLYL